MGGYDRSEKGARLQDASEAIEAPSWWPVVRMRRRGGAGANAELLEVREGFKGVKEA